MSSTSRPNQDIDELVRLNCAAQTRADSERALAAAPVDSSGDESSYAKVEDSPDHVEMVEEAVAIEEAWLAGREVEPAPSTPESSSKSGRGQRFSRWLRRSWTVTSWVGVGLVALLVLVISAAIVVPKVQGWTGMVVLSGSMEPALPVGSMAFMEPLGTGHLDSIERGDILTYRQEQLPSLISHRVVDIIETDQGPSFVTKGDANNTTDAQPVPADRVVGIVRYDVPHVGAVVQKLQDRITYYVFLGIPAGLLIATELWSIGTQIVRARRESRLGDGARS